MIPKTIWQTSKEDYEHLPPYLKIMTQTWKDSGWTYNYVTNQEAGQWLYNQYGSIYKEMYDYITVPFCKADFWRYFVLKKYGGLYVDIDTVCLQPPETWIDLEADMNVSEEWFPEFGHTTYSQWLIACPPESKFINAMIGKMVTMVRQAMNNGIPVSPTQTGPGPWTEALTAIKDDTLNIVTPSENVHHYVGNSSWSDMSGKTVENLVWDVRRHNVKLFDEGYNSIGDEIIWG